MTGSTKWTVIMSRYDGSLSFDRPWADYKSGFGEVDQEHWLGLDIMHYLTNQGQYKVRFEMREWQSTATKWSEYSIFKIGPESSNYRLTIGGESMTAAKGHMGYHNGTAFTMKDRDNESYSSRNCAVNYVGAWWHKDCFHVFLTGPYTSDCASKMHIKCMSWDLCTPLDRVIGKVDQEHWLGLDIMHYLTNQGQYKVRFEMREWQSKATKWSEYSIFKIGPESSNYRLTIGGESGTATRGRMGRHNGASSGVVATLKASPATPNRRV